MLGKIRVIKDFTGYLPLTNQISYELKNGIEAIYSEP
jgi:hypothetical protein